MRNLVTAALTAVGLWLTACASPPPAAFGRGRLCDPATIGSLRTEAHEAEVDTIVLDVRDDRDVEAVAAAAAQVRAAGLQLGYWFEVGRSEALASAHPEWVATLQAHHEWQLEHPGAPQPGADEVVIAWPWVPVGYAESFAAHRERIRKRLAALPRPDVVFLNDLQGPPSACGCGNVLCRWATDYTLHGAVPRRSATPLGPDAAARFVAAVRQMVPEAEVVPVWVTECELDDTKADGACHGVGCYHGACWREFEKQWAPVRAASATVALLLPYRAFGRDLARFGVEAGWVRFAIEHLRERERQRGRGIDDGSLVAVLQGWGDADVAAQRAAVEAAGLRRVLVAEHEIVQRLDPRLRRDDER